MSIRLNISAGEFFDLIRPVVLGLSALLSIAVFAHARKRFPIYVLAAWAVGTLLYPLIVLPLYLIAVFTSKRREQSSGSVAESGAADSKQRPGIWLLLTYLAIVLLFVGGSLYADRESVDAHLARAAQAKVSGNRSGAISKYRAALRMEENAHTRKLLATELSVDGYWTEALSDFRLAESGGEPDDSVSFQIARLLDLLNHPHEATLEYERFLNSRACTQSLPDYRCALVTERIQRAQDFYQRP